MKQSSFIQITSRRRRRIGFTITELLTLVAAIAVALCLVIPAIGSVKSPSRVNQSLSNLRTLFAAHQAYANDWAGRQVTFAIDGLGAYGHLAAYQAATGSIHPPIVLGWGCAQENGSSLWRYDFSGPANSLLLYPIASNQRYGNFRLVNAKPLNSYVNGKIFEPTYFAPADGIVLNKVTPYFTQPCEMPNGIGSLFPWSSYCFSPAGFYDPITHDRKHPNYPGPGQPIPTSLQAPAIAAARYPDLKTHILEHNWLQNAPIWCNPNLSGGPYSPTCEPYYFNHAIVSEPATVFYDGHTRLLPNTECIAGDVIVEQQTQTVDGLWFSAGGALNAGNLSSDGYFESIGFDQIEIRHSILTIDGILGRDTLGPIF